MSRAELRRRPAVRHPRLHQPLPAGRRPGPVRPRAWWRWPTTRPPDGAGWGGAGRPRPGPACSSRSCSARCSTRTSSTCAPRRVALAAADACAVVAGVSPGRQVAERPVVGDASWPGCWPSPTPAAPGGPPGSVAVVVGIGCNVDWPGPDGGRAAPRSRRGRRSHRSTARTCSRPSWTPWARAVRALDSADGRAALADELRARCETLGRVVRVELAGDEPRVRRAAGRRPHGRGSPGGRDGGRPAGGGGRRRRAPAARRTRTAAAPGDQVG